MLALGETPKFVDLAALSAVDVAIGHGVRVENEVRVAIETFHLHVNIAAPQGRAVGFKR